MYIVILFFITGPQPDSEPETKAIQNSINKYLGEWTTYLTLHT